MLQDRREHVSLWHPWRDKPGQRHTVALWQDFDYPTIDKTVRGIADGQFYAICKNILSRSEVDPLLLRDKHTEAYLSHSGGCVALRVKHSRKSGFLLPSMVWGQKSPCREMVGRLNYIFNKFGFEAITPPSLSEKVLRSTLADKLYISRPCKPLRQSLLDNGKGGRIQHRNGKHEEGYESDLIKAYLYFSQYVPSPFVSPVRFVGSDIWQSHKTAWMECHLTCHRKDNGIQPIQIKDSDTGDMREARDGETFTTWLWKGELEDCQEYGYTVHDVSQGWSWMQMSTFMQPWSDILWKAYQEEEDESVREIEKQMMVGLPGRFLKSPEKYTLVHYTESRKGDKPLLNNWQDGESPLSEWCMRIEEDEESAQLTPVGSYIISECRRELFKASRLAEHHGHTVVRLYVDSLLVSGASSPPLKYGSKRGEYKSKRYTKIRIYHNHFKGEINGIVVLKAPGISGENERKNVLQEMESISWQRQPP